MRIKQYRFYLVLVGGALILAACGATSTTQDPVETRRFEPAPDFQLTVYQGADELGGETVQLSDLLAQGKPIVLNFWAGLCPPCRVEMPDLQAVYEEFNNRILLVGLDVGPFIALGSREDAKALLKELEISYPAGSTFEPQVVTDYNVIGMPSTYFITPQGEIFDTWTGLLTRDKLTELVEALLEASGS